MPGHELRVEQSEAAIFEPRHEIDERDLARVARAAEHAFAEEGAAEMHAVKSARELPVLPHLDRMAMAECEQLPIKAPDAPIDPGRAAS
jgi:diaminopimelate decarboxylase